MNAVDALPGAVAEVVAEATGQQSRTNAVLPGSGGPAGNALLTAWTALVLLVLSVAELLTLFDVRGLITWHVAIGALLIPPAVMKTGSTTWRMVRYYLGNRPYQEAGPPPLVLRVLGPLVVISTLGLLGTGVLLVLLGDAQAHSSLVTLLGFRLDWVALHQAFFAVWAGATALHLAGRILPALSATVVRRETTAVPGGPWRVLWFAAMTVSAAALAVVLVSSIGTWSSDHEFGHDEHHAAR